MAQIHLQHLPISRPILGLVGLLSLAPSIALAEPGNTPTTRNITACSRIADTHARVDCEIGVTPYLPPPIVSLTWTDSAIAEPAPQIFTPPGAAHKFPWGQCTYYVASRRKITFRGNAKEWLKNGKAAGYTVASTPRVGAVMVTAESRWGHVSYVEAVEGHRITVSEMNVVGLGTLSRRTFITGDKRIRGFIH